MSQGSYINPPLFIDVSNRRCRHIYLGAVHLLLTLLMFFSQIPLNLLVISLLVVSVSGGYWLRQELRGTHPKILKWNESMGWRLTVSGTDLSVSAIRYLQMPRCLLLEVKSGIGREVIFLTESQGMNRLRYQLRASVE